MRYHLTNAEQIHSVELESFFFLNLFITAKNLLKSKVLRQIYLSRRTHFHQTNRAKRNEKYRIKWKHMECMVATESFPLSFHAHSLQCIAKLRVSNNENFHIVSDS